MNLFCIGYVVGSAGSNIVGYRIYDISSKKYKDVSVSGVAKVLKNGTQIAGMSVDNQLGCRWDTADFSTGGYIIQGIGVGKSSYTVVAKDIGDMWQVVDTSGQDYSVNTEGLMGICRNRLNTNFWYDNTQRNIVVTSDIAVAKRASQSQTIEKRSRLFGKKYEYLKYNSDGEVSYNLDFELDSIEIPEGVEVIAYKGFRRAPVKNIKMPSSLKIIKEMAFQCSTVESIEFVPGIVDIRDGAFEECKNLKELKLPSTVKHLGRGMLSGSGVKKIYAPAILVMNGVLKNVQLLGKYVNIVTI